MAMKRRDFLVGATTMLGSLRYSAMANAQATEVIRIGHITDMSGAYRDVEGPTGVAGTQLAIDEFAAANPHVRVELLVADHQNKSDVGLGIVRRWIDQDGVDLVTNVGNSALALAVRSVVAEKDKVAIVTAAATSELTGAGCSTNLLHWTYDTWSLAHATPTGVVGAGGATWYFITANYAFGHAAQADISRFVEQAGGKVLGAVRYPYGATTDFSSFLLQAQGSGAKVICFVNSGADLVNCMKQAQEFKLRQAGVKFAAAVGLINDIVAMGLDVAQGLSVAEAFYWDFNDRTRALTRRIRAKAGPAVLPNMTQAGDYSAVTHYLRAVKLLGAQKAKSSGRGIIDVMKSIPTDDDAFGSGMVRADGRKLHPMHVFEVKAPSESKYQGDVFRHLSSISTEQAFRPLKDGGCPLIKS